ncbi:aldo/keto reductase [Enterococcus faecalis]|uniref:aldo/keto reductase n=1 Tax=Enterococcus faecalis TaxID=1351 RepID=UPI0001F0C755|nr:aldo/keto reductase [Enterococcus faecalis]EFT95197.1 oxidoreductase, aldo/keto reductase family protein [Enterococcus faecalis TX0012]
MILQENYKLNNGVLIPKLGFGTWMIDNDSVVQTVKDALELGYRHIDTAQAYENENGVGKAIRTSKIDRSEIFVTSKIAAEHKSYDAASMSIDDSLTELGLETIDLMIIHAPQPWSEFRDGNYDSSNIEVWKALEDAYRQKKVRAIGVSNFKQHDLENILKNSNIKPMVNQILAHIANTPFDLIEYCEQNNVLVEAYSPVGHGELLKSEELKAIAEKYQVSISQLAIRYCLELGLLPLPKSAKKAHIKNNSEMDFEILESDLEILKGFKQIQDYGESSHFPVFNKK